MKIIKWNEEVTVSLDEKSKRLMFVKLLTRTVTDLWAGKIVRSKTAANDNGFKSPYVEVRKTIGGSSLLFRIGHKAKRVYSGGFVPNTPVPKGVVVELSMNQRAQFAPDDFEELNLVALEATGVIEAMYKDAV